MYSIIALCGNKGSGKSTVAEWLQKERGYKIKSFADPLKELAMLLFPEVMTEAVCYGPSASREKVFSEVQHRQLLSHVRSGRKNLHLDPTLQDLLRTLFGDTPRREIADRFFMVFMEEPLRTLRSGRSILQLLGTEWGRGLADDAWVKALAAELTPGSKYVVPDLRFPNEGAMLRAKGAGIFWVDASARLAGAPKDNHASEPSREDLAFCLSDTIPNTGTREELFAALTERF